MHRLELVVSSFYTSCPLHSVDGLSTIDLESDLHLETGRALVAMEIDVLVQRQHCSPESLGIEIVDVQTLVAVPCIQASEV